jgi:hypothetical protein
MAVTGMIDDCDFRHGSRPFFQSVVTMRQMLKRLMDETGLFEYSGKMKPIVSGFMSVSGGANEP